MSDDRNTGRQILFGLAVLSLALYLLFYHNYVSPLHISDLFSSIDIISVTAAILIFALILSLLVALIPFRKKDYMFKLSYTIPTSVILTCLLFGLGFYAAGPHYNVIAVDPNTNCSSVKNGVFEIGNYRFERNGPEQLEINTKTKKAIRVDVTWLSDCEYQLSYFDSIKGNRTVNVKIVSVDSTGYDCYTWSGGSAPTQHFRMNRAKQ